MLNRILAGAPSRKTRLHDEKGNRITGSRLIRNGPRALLTGLSRVVLDRRPERPWISYDAQAALDSFLRPDSCVLEFGSGMSTIWYARRARKVVSIENHEAWYAIVQKMFRDNNISNVDYRHAGSKEAYLEFPHECYDLIMVDGRWRDECVEAALPYLAPGGMIYLDNSDKSSNPVTGDIPRGEALIARFVRDHGGSIEHFTDFAPTQMFVEQGLLAKIPAENSR